MAAAAQEGAPDQLEAVLAAARRLGASQAEAFSVRTEETPVRFEANRLKELNARHTSGVAVRVVKDGRIGFAASTRPGDVEELAAAAVETAPFGPGAHLRFPGPAPAPPVRVFDAETEALPVDRLIEIGQRLIDDACAAEPELVCDAHVRRVVSEATILNTNGGLFRYRATVLSAGVYGQLVRGTDMLFVGDADASCRPNLALEQISETVRRQLELSRRTAGVRTGEMPVIFTPLGVADALVGPLAAAFSGRLVHQGQSPLAGCLGREVYDRRFSLRDDATIDYRAASRPFDDEGVPSRRNVLVDKGVVRCFLYDLQTAGLAKTESTGSAERSLASQPAIAAASLQFATGDVSFEEMVSGVKEGIVVEELMGAGQGNVLGGDFSGNVLLGYKIENGEIVGRVKDTIVAGNVHAALGRIGALGREGRWVGGAVFAPPILFERLAVSAK